MYRQRKRRTASQPENTQPEQLKPHQPVFLTTSSVYDEITDLDTEPNNEQNDPYDHPEAVPRRPVSTPNVYLDLVAAADQPVRSSGVSLGTYIHPKTADDPDTVNPDQHEDEVKVTHM